MKALKKELQPNGLALHAAAAAAAAAVGAAVGILLVAGGVQNLAVVVGVVVAAAAAGAKSYSMGNNADCDSLSLVRTCNSCHSDNCILSQLWKEKILVGNRILNIIVCQN